MDHRTRLQNLLRDLFQFDSADLDFGIYRILNQRRAEIEKFIQSGLLDAVTQEFGLLEAGVIAEKQAELTRIIGEIQAAYGAEAIDADGNFALPQFAQLPLVLRFEAKRAELAQVSVSAEAEAEIFSALYTFFSRYYDNGDFVSKRRYSRTEKYAIPYNGEEVYFHWANRDQYYVKTADALTDYAFGMDSHGGYRVRFKLAAADVEQNNVKGEKRYFLPAKKGVAEFDETKRELTLFFEYRPLTEEEKEKFDKNGVQAKIIEASRDRLLKAVPDTTLRALLATAPADDQPPLLDGHLTRWARKSTSDYFIHKDLRYFLERELDFFLKNEVMRLDDLDTENAVRAEHYLTRLVVIKRIAKHIIDFLAHIEGFQKRLFECPKFVLASEWCATLDRVPKSLYPTIVANKVQWEEWGKLFGVKKPKGNGMKVESFFSEHPTLTIDTALYDADFKDQLLAALSEAEDGLTGQMDGLLVHGENFQALRLLREAYRGGVKCIHIDPPYNTQTSGFLYKNEYQHSSWLSMMENRIEAGLVLMSRDGSFLCHIDENEYERLQLLFERISLPDAGTIAWDKRNPMNAGRGVATQHEYVVWRTRQETPIYLRNDSILSMLSAATEIIQRHGGVTEEAQREYAAWVNGNKELTGGERAYRFLDEQGRVYRGVSLRAPEPRTDPRFHKPLIHPVTGKPCPVPPNGFSRTPETLQAMIEKGEIIFGEDETTQPNQKMYLTEESRRQISSVIQDARKGKADLDPLGLYFPYCHPVSLYKTLIGAATQSQSDIVCDFFAGSGTTGHAVINLNRDDGGNCRYILVEQGEYFDTVLKPRIQKVIYAAEWKDGQPIKGSPGSSHAFQYLRLESYEDTLDNLDLRPELAPLPGLFPPETDDYLLKYMLDHETRELRLNVRAFEMPFDYELRVRRDGVETRVKVYLLETANFLLGLTVQVRRAYQHQKRTYRVVFGTAREGDSVAVIWRDTAGLDFEKETEFVRDEILSGKEPDRLYVNGDSRVPGARPIEAVFMKVMRGEG